MSGDDRKYNVKVGIIGGSGLNNPDILEGGVEKKIKTPFGFPSDVLIEGKINGVDCVLLARHGRQHSVNPSNVNYRANIWALKSLNCTHVIVSTAVGSLREDIKPGDFIAVDGVIDRTQKRVQTFYDGSEPTCTGVCHVPMEPLFCERTRQVLIDTAQELGIKLHKEGTAVSIEGPRFSTKAESNLFRSWGCHVVNMTLVPEVFLAKEAGLCYAAVAMATDYDCWREGVVNVNSVLETFKANVHKITKLFTVAVPKIAAQNWDESISILRDTVEKSNMTVQPKK